MDSKKKVLKKIDSDEDSGSDNDSVGDVEYEQVDITNIKSELVFFIYFQ